MNQETINNLTPVTPPPTASCVLSLDLGTMTGWAIRLSSGETLSGTARLQQDRWQGGGMRFVRFTRLLDQLQRHAGPVSMVFFEEVRRHLGVDAAHVYGGFLAHLTAWCEHRQIPYEGVPVGTIKRHITGKGNASKAMVIAAVKALGYCPDDDNEADALALMEWAVANRLEEVRDGIDP